jgi:predicted type IV restriction endonuclease
MYTDINACAILEVTLPCPKEVFELVDRFNRNSEAYLSGGYNEEQLRNEFINPFFKSLGYDVFNKRKYHTNSKENPFDD